jgi:hypothetical protein
MGENALSINDSKTHFNSESVMLSVLNNIRAASSNLFTMATVSSSESNGTLYRNSKVFSIVLIAKKSLPKNNLFCLIFR